MFSIQIEFPLPDIKTKRKIFQIHTNKMTLAEDVALDEFVMAKDEMSGADIKVYGLCYVVNCKPYFCFELQAVCTEAGLLALRERRMKVVQADFKKAKEKVLYRKKQNIPEGLYV